MDGNPTEDTAMAEVRRRDFLKGFGGAMVAGGGALAALRGILPAHADDVLVGPEIVRFAPDMEPIVRWIENAPRGRIIEGALERLRDGLPYRRLLGGVFLAGIRNIKPRPVGFKFHAVMVVSSAHQLALDAPQDDRLVPLLWALDNFKASQEADVREGDWALPPVKESAVPSPSQARAAFRDAMEKWDAEAADAAVAGLCRGASSGEVMEALWPYGLRDWENIGHKIIFTAHAWRTLETIGWQHAEPVLRSLVFGILNGSSDDSAAPYAANLELIGTVRKGWAAGRRDDGATAAFLEALRTASPGDAARKAVEALNQGIAPESLWDAVFLAGGELSMRRPGIVALHATTASNSLHYTHLSSAVESTRLLALLQAASWLPLYREALRARDGLPEDGPRIDRLEPAPAAEAVPAADLFEGLARDRMKAARAILARSEWSENPAPFMDAARRLVFAKGTDSHDFKYAAAAFEEAPLASPKWRPRLLAASAFHLRGTTDADSPLLERARHALKAVKV
jgi:hypothetical protein